MLLQLPECILFKIPATEYSDPTVLYCVGTFFADQIKRITGSKTLGGILQYFHGMDLVGVEEGLCIFARNARAGQFNDKGQPIGEVNQRVMATLIGLMRLGFERPDYFSHHPNIRNRLSLADFDYLEEKWGSVVQLR